MKKGAVISSRDPLATYKVAILYPSWYYTWSPTSLKLPLEHVPMIWSPKHIPLLKTRDIVLGFNEPDHHAQSNITAEDAAVYYCDFMQSNAIIGSPAMAGNVCERNSWLDQYLTAGGGFDFLAMHMYVPPNVEDTILRVKRAYKKYKKPIWITEFAAADVGQSLEENLEYMNRLIRQLDGMECVERYVWKDKLGISQLFDEYANITKVGELYHFI